MALKSNDFSSDASVIRNRKENGSCSLNGDSVLPQKWKPRNVSAVRLFPPGCGSIVHPVNVVSQQADTSSSLVNNKNNGSNDFGMSKSLSHGVGLIVEPHKVETETLVNKELQNGDNQVVWKEELSGPVNAVVQVDDVKLDNGGSAIKEAIPKIKLPWRRVSAVRNFPPHCGLNATDPTEEERIRINGKRSFGAVDEGGGSNVRLTEAIVVGGEQSNGSVKQEFLQGTQSDELSNESPMANQETGATVTVLPLNGLMGDKVGVGVGDERSTEKMIVGCEESKVDGKVQNFEHDVTGVEPNSMLHTVPQNGDNAITGQVCQDLVVYTRDKVLKRRCSVDGHDEDSEWKFQDESIQNCETKGMVAIPIRSLAPIQKNMKNISGQLRNVGHEKHLKKRPLDGTKDLGFIGKERRVVLGLMAPSPCPRGSLEKDLTNMDDSTRRSKAKVHASVTPKKSIKTKAGYGEKDVGKNSSSTGKVAYTGTLDMVVRDDEHFVVDTEEKGEESPISQGAHDVDVTLPPFGPKSSSDARNKVRETLRLFQALCRKLLQGEEAKTREGDETRSGLPKNRVDLSAKTILQERGRAPDRGKKTWGPVPGVEVGDEFQYRVELALVGIHWRLQEGIDYFKHGKDLVAVSIVASGGYDNELGQPDCLTYSGSGGIGKDKKFLDQKLERGNLALKNNIVLKHPVRVIRGYKGKAIESSDSKSRAATTYIYDGLYSVDRYWQEPGPLGNLVFKFELRRIPGQPELALREVKSKKFKIREGLCVDDITGGKEVFPICAVNTIDNEKPPSFNYITKIVYPDWSSHVPPKGCDCAGRCSDKRCSCAFKNGGEIPYNHNGAIVEAKQLVYECGPSCRCPPTCYNRVTQHGMKIQLEIFKTESRGWGVRSLISISSGSFICEYIGELLEDTEAEKRTGNDEYLFDIGQNYTDCSLNPDTKSSSGEIVDAGGFTIDAANYGNVGRFINHSCSPNLYAQNVLYDQEDKRMPHIMLFAAENIPPLQELTYHYNYAVDTVHDSDGNIKIKRCYCGSSGCTGRLY